MKYAVIKSNHGNHTGFNRKWRLIDVVSTKKEAKEILVDKSMQIERDSHIPRNGRVWCVDNKEYVYTTNLDGFSDDGCMYTYVKLTENSIDDFFRGDFNGYRPRFINELISA